MKVDFKKFSTYNGLICGEHSVIRDYAYKITLCGNEVNDYNYELIVGLNRNTHRTVEKIDPLILAQHLLPELLHITYHYISCKVRQNESDS